MSLFKKRPWFGQYIPSAFNLPIIFQYLRTLKLKELNLISLQEKKNEGMQSKYLKKLEALTELIILSHFDSHLRSTLGTLDLSLKLNLISLMQELT